MKISFKCVNLWLIFFRGQIMCCKNFGIGLIALSITLVLGIVISETLKLNEIPEIAVVEEKVLTLEEAVLKDCVPADPKLKYHLLSEDKTKTVTVKVKNAEEFKKFLAENKDDSEAEKELKKIEKEAEIRGSSFQTLVFTQKCRSEKDAQ